MNRKKVLLFGLAGIGAGIGMIIFGNTLNENARASNFPTLLSISGLVMIPVSVAFVFLAPTKAQGQMNKTEMRQTIIRSLVSLYLLGGLGLVGTAVVVAKESFHQPWIEGTTRILEILFILVLYGVGGFIGTAGYTRYQTKRKIPDASPPLDKEEAARKGDS